MRLRTLYVRQAAANGSNTVTTIAVTLNGVLADSIIVVFGASAALRDQTVSDSVNAGNYRIANRFQPTTENATIGMFHIKSAAGSPIVTLANNGGTARMGIIAWEVVGLRTETDPLQGAPTAKTQIDASAECGLVTMRHHGIIFTGVKTSGVSDTITPDAAFTGLQTNSTGRVHAVHRICNAEVREAVHTISASSSWGGISVSHAIADVDQIQKRIGQVNLARLLGLAPAFRNG